MPSTISQPHPKRPQQTSNIPHLELMAESWSKNPSSPSPSQSPPSLFSPSPSPPLLNLRTRKIPNYTPGHRLGQTPNPSSYYIPTEENYDSDESGSPWPTPGPGHSYRPALYRFRALVSRVILGGVDGDDKQKDVDLEKGETAEQFLAATRRAPRSP